MRPDVSATQLAFDEAYVIRAYRRDLHREVGLDSRAVDLPGAGWLDFAVLSLMERSYAPHAELRRRRFDGRAHNLAFSFAEESASSYVRRQWFAQSTKNKHQ